MSVAQLRESLHICVWIAFLFLKAVPDNHVTVMSTEHAERHFVHTD